MADDTAARMRASGLTQVELARRLGVSQGHVSKVLSGRTPAGNKLRRSVIDLLTVDPRASVDDEWVEAVAEAARRSAEFRMLVGAALKLMQ